MAAAAPSSSSVPTIPITVNWVGSTPAPAPAAPVASTPPTPTVSQQYAFNVNGRQYAIPIPAVEAAVKIMLNGVGTPADDDHKEIHAAMLATCHCPLPTALRCQHNHGTSRETPTAQVRCLHYATESVFGTTADWAMIAYDLRCGVHAPAGARACFHDFLPSTTPVLIGHYCPHHAPLMKERLRYGRELIVRNLAVRHQQAVQQRFQMVPPPPLRVVPPPPPPPPPAPTPSMTTTTTTTTTMFADAAGSVVERPASAFRKVVVLPPLAPRHPVGSAVSVSPFPVYEVDTEDEDEVEKDGTQVFVAATRGRLRGRGGRGRGRGRGGRGRSLAASDSGTYKRARLDSPPPAPPLMAVASPPPPPPPLPFVSALEPQEQQQQQQEN